MHSVRHMQSMFDLSLTPPSGNVPLVDAILPPRPPPRPPAPGEETLFRPVATGSGFFTPAAGSNGNLFRLWKPDTISRPSGPRDSLYVPCCVQIYRCLTCFRSTVDSSFFADDSFQFKAPALPASRSQPGPADSVQPPAVRPLSSADEMGPVAKKLRSAVRPRVPPPSSAADSNLKPSKSAGALPEGADDRTKSSKARARPALTIANIFSSPGRRVQHAATSSRSTTATAKQPAATLGLTRRSSRLQLGTSNAKAKPPPKVGLSVRLAVPASQLTSSRRTPPRIDGVLPRGRGRILNLRWTTSPRRWPGPHHRPPRAPRRRRPRVPRLPARSRCRRPHRRRTRWSWQIMPSTT